MLFGESVGWVELNAIPIISPRGTKLMGIASILALRAKTDAPPILRICALAKPMSASTAKRAFGLPG
jgi:hypothetical protein